MPDDRTTVTELATALGMFPCLDVGSALEARPVGLAISDATWAQLADLHSAGAFADEFAAAFANDPTAVTNLFSQAKTGLGNVIANQISTLTDPINGDRDTGSCTTPAAVAGYPHITVPAGFYHGLPIGLSFFGAAWSEPVLLKLAYAWEQETKARKKPGFASSAMA